MADLLALVCDVYYDFVTFPFCILRQVWYLIPDPCCLSYFKHMGIMCLTRDQSLKGICVVFGPSFVF